MEVVDKNEIDINEFVKSGSIVKRIKTASI